MLTDSEALNYKDGSLANNLKFCFPSNMLKIGSRATDQTGQESYLCFSDVSYIGAFQNTFCVPDITLSD